ncbi:VTT domain-containing protein [Dermabacter hominis]|uniref:DedA family protein n=1 Tax=Dermabacter TaxID=36739 RepID=UPI00290CF40F|nr:VTT domain-containing protein [Dermabacter sp.]MDK8803432.1 VTT domain-containing protein [Dermabacter hominis]MDU4922989.1 VTT domain-containing protein [Dermabacter sp.]
MHVVEEIVVHAGEAWWIHLVVAAFSLVDAFFPTVPSESLLVALGSLWATSGKPSLLLLILSGWGGAAIGDHVTYQIGRVLPWRKLAFFNEGRRGHRAIEAAERGLEKHAFTYLMTARFIPLGRTAVNLVAGGVRYPRSLFTPKILLATFLWAVYSCLVGAVAGQWFEAHPILGILAALALAFAVSLLVERLVRRLHALKAKRASESA